MALANSPRARFSTYTNTQESEKEGTDAAVAQWIEHCPCHVKVAGLAPTRGKLSFLPQPFPFSLLIVQFN